MKYYAVTDDVNELYHYGVKGMKWGQHLFGEDPKPKSAGYRHAAAKLRSLSKSTRNDVETWGDRRYRRKVEKALQRSARSQAKYGWDQVANGIKENERAFKLARKEVAKAQKIRRNEDRYQERKLRSEEKQARMAAKAEKKFDRYLQDAREGHLHAGNLSSEQIQRINDRLNAERMTRQLGGSEKMSYRARKREAFREGKIEGIKRGTAAGMEALAKGVVEIGIKNRVVKNLNNRAEAKRQRTKNRILNKKSHRDIKREIKEEAYEESLRENPSLIKGGTQRLLGTVNSGLAAKNLNKLNAEKHQRERIQAAQDKAMDENEAGYRKLLAESGVTEKEALQNFYEGNYGREEQRRLSKAGNKSEARKRKIEGKNYKKLSDAQKRSVIIENQRRLAEIENELAYNKNQIDPNSLTYEEYKALKRLTGNNNQQGKGKGKRNKNS